MKQGGIKLTKDSSSLVDKIWNFFSSMKLGLVLLGIIAVVSGIGTVFPQEAEDPVKAEAVNKIWQTIGLTHIYSSSWFRLLLGLLCINLIVCSAQRFNGIFLRTFKPNLPNSPAAVPQKVRQVMIGQSSDLRQKIQTILRSKRYILKLDETENGWSFVGIKRRLGNWGSFLTHVAFIVLIIGALIGFLMGFKGHLMAVVGSTNPIQSIQLSKGIVTQNFNVKINSFEPRFLPDGDRENWYTDMSIIDNGKEAVRQTISTNHPLTYNGVTFYQSSWAIGITLDLNGQKYPELLYEGDSTGYFQLPGSDLSLNINVGQNLRQPTITYQLRKGYNQVQQGQVQAGQTIDLQGKGKLTLDGWVTGLQVKQDPGVPVIWLGSALLFIGLFLSFYWRPVYVSGVFENGEDKSGKLTIGISTAKSFTERAAKELEEIALLIKVEGVNH